MNLLKFFKKDEQPKINPQLLLRNYEQELKKSDAQDSNALLAELGLSRSQLLKSCQLDDEFESCREDLRSALLARSYRIWGDGVDDETINRLYQKFQKIMPTLADIVINTRLAGYCVGEYVYVIENNEFMINQVINRIGTLEEYEVKIDGLKHRDDPNYLRTDVKFLLLTSRADGSNLSGDPLAVRAWKAIQIRKTILPRVDQYLRRYAQPYIVGQLSAYSDQPQSFLDKLFAFASGGALTIGKDDNVQIHKLDSNGDAFLKIEQLACAQIQKLLLGRVKTSELETGSRSAQEVDNQILGYRINAYLDLLAEAGQSILNAYLLANQLYATPIKAPKGLWFEFTKDADIDLKRAERDAKYLATGKVELTEDYFIDVLGFEAKHFQMVRDKNNNKNIDLSLSLANKEAVFNPELWDDKALTLSLAEALNDAFEKGLNSNLNEV